MIVTVAKYTFEFHREVLAILNHFTQNEKHQSEAGGIIIGKIFDNRINILKLSIPTELDKASRTNFERNRVSGQIIINYEFHNSSHQNIYVGEWHTHPEDVPNPSEQDMDMIHEQFTVTKIATDFLLLLIKGRKKMFLGVVDKSGFHTEIVTM